MSTPSHRIPEGFACAAGFGAAGPYAAVLVRPDRDKPFVHHLGERDNTTGAELKPGKTLAQWREALVGTSRLRAVLVTRKGGAWQETDLTEAERIEGPAVASRTDAEALVAWSGRKEGRWELRLYRDGATETVLVTERVLRAPAVAEAEGTVYLACQAMEPKGCTIRLVDGTGTVLLETTGRNPRLERVGKRVYLLHERPAPSACTLVLTEIESGEARRSWDIPAADDLNLNAALASDPEAETLYIAHETTPAWGYDHMLGRHRELCLWRLAANGSGPEAVAHTANGRLPVPYAASHGLNRTALQPRVCLLEGEPAVAFRRHQYYLPGAFAWHCFLIRHTPAGWTAPVRISPEHGLPETAYAVLGEGAGVLTALPCSAQTPGLTREEYDRGEEGRSMGRVHETWVELATRPAEKDLGPVAPLPNHNQGTYTITLAARDVAPDPGPVRAEEGTPRLIWGDLHQHTVWSKCIAPIDGTREENLRYQRDMLGCRVFSFGEHTTMMSDSEFTYYLDQMEAEAGADGIVLYGCEPWSLGHDTNFYAIDREVFEWLRYIYLCTRSLKEMIHTVAREFPHREVAALRHFHGPTVAHFEERGDPDLPWGSNAPEVPSTHVPAVEPAMEAMQIRGNVMMYERDGQPRFPVNFLNGGAKIGLVGGSDHSSPKDLKNHFCLTGFWADEPTAEGVWKALWNRKTLAASNGKIALWPTVEGAVLGEEVKAAGPVRVRVRFAAARPVTRMTLIRDGEILPWTAVNAANGEIELTDPDAAAGARWYCVTAEGESAPDLQAPVLVHASPFFVNQE